MVRGLAERFPDHGIEGEVYVTAPGAEIDEDHPLVGALDEAHAEVFGAAPERDVTRWFSDASVLTRYGIATVNYGTSTGLLDTVKGENLEIDGLVKTAEVYARAAMKRLRSRVSGDVTCDDRRRAHSTRCMRQRPRDSSQVSWHESAPSAGRRCTASAGRDDRTDQSMSGGRSRRLREAARPIGGFALHGAAFRTSTLRAARSRRDDVPHGVAAALASGRSVGRRSRSTDVRCSRDASMRRSGRFSRAARVRPMRRDAVLAARSAMKLVTFGDERRVGVLDGDEIAVLDVPTMREYFERGGADETGERVALAETRLRAPIVPKKFFHTAGNFREHEEESKQVGWSHEIAPWIVFFQNVDAIVGPDEPVVYPEHLTEELDYELELAVVIEQGREVVLAGGGDRLHRRLRDLQRHHRARHPAARDALRRLLLLQGDRHVLPARAVDRHARRDPRPARPRDGAARQRRGRGRPRTRAA